MNLTNPILRGFHPDPSICRVGADYYLATSSFEYAPGVPLYHSRDLVHWKHVAYAFPEPRHLPFDKHIEADGIWAPTLRFIGGRFYVIATVARRDSWPEMFSNYYVSAPSIEGPWSDPVLVTDGGIDPDLFEDRDGTVYYSQNMGCKTAPIDLATGKLQGDLKTIWAGMGDAYAEAPHIYRIDDYYYVLLAEGGTGMGHCVSIARAPSLEGPFEGCPWNPVLTHRGRNRRVQSVGHADLVQTPEGDWYAVCLAVRDSNGISPLGRETHLMPVVWKEGWPVFAEGGQMADLESLTDPAAEPLVLHDNFESEVAPLFWNTRLGWGQETILRSKGTLKLTPTQATLKDDAEVAWLGTRQPDFNVISEVTVDASTLAEGQTAGLCVYLNPRYHLTIHLRREEGRLRIESRLKAGETQATLASLALADPASRRLIVECSARDEWGSIKGAYILRHAATSEGGAIELARSDLRLFGGVVTGSGYTGTFIACFAEGTANPVSFRDFKCVSAANG